MNQEAKATIEMSRIHLVTKEEIINKMKNVERDREREKLA